MSAIESTHAKFEQQMSEVLHSSQQNTVVLNNLSSMFSILMEKMGTQATIFEPTTPTAQVTNSNMPSLDPILNSGAGSDGETPRMKRSKMVRTGETLDDPTLSPKGDMGSGQIVEGLINQVESKGDVEEGNGSVVPVPIQGGSLGGGENVSAPVADSGPSQVAIHLEGGNVSPIDAGSGSKVVGSEGDGKAMAANLEGGSGGSTPGIVERREKGL